MARFASARMFLLFMLLAWITGACALIDEDLSDVGDHTLTLAMSVKNMKSGPDLTTKMSEDIIQYNGSTFRGIEQVYVIPFHIDDSSPARVVPATERWGTQNVKMESPTIGRTGRTALVDNNHSRLFSQTIIPVGMNAVLVYGKASDKEETNIKEKKRTNGSLIPDSITNPSSSDDICFHLDPILSTGDDDEKQQIEDKADLLLSKLNGIITTMRESEVSEVVDAYVSLKNESENQILSCSFDVFNRICIDIQSALINILINLPPGSEDLPKKILEINSINSGVVELSNFLYSNEIGEHFPSSYGIPDGAFGFWWNGNEFIRLINTVNIALVDPASYCYPPSLWYYANSPVKTSKSEDTRSLYVPSMPTWEAILDKYDDGDIVKYGTLGVAVVDQLQYGVGMLELKLNEPKPEIAALVNNCPLTGIIIGDQRDVDFSFQPTSASGRFIYDKLNGDLKIGETEKRVKTLVLQTQENAKVHFALEFKNNSETKLHCQQGLILPQCKFYLVGELDPTKNNVTSPQGENLKSVFCQDRITTVYVTIKGLMSAYNTVPDLRDPQLEIGIIANMNWESVTPESITLKL